MPLDALALSLVLATAPVASSEDVRAIEELHRRDVEAAKAFDVEALTGLATEGVVILPPDALPLEGSSALREMLEPLRGQRAELEVTDYDQEWQELIVAGDYAFEWAIVRTSARVKASGEIIREKQKLLRVLKRTQDGRWKVHRAMWNNLAP